MNKSGGMRWKGAAGEVVVPKSKEGSAGQDYGTDGIGAGRATAKDANGRLRRSAALQK